MYSDHENLHAYSVVLHSFVLRIIFDHGLFGILILLYSVNKYLEISSYKGKERLSILLIIIATGLSVSSLNSVFVTLSLGLIIATSRNKGIKE